MGFKAGMGRKRQERRSQKRRGMVAPTVNTLTSLQAASCFSCWVLGTPTMGPLILMFLTLLSCLQSLTLSSCCRSRSFRCLCGPLQSLFPSDGTFQSRLMVHRVFIAISTLPLALLCTTYIVHLLPCCLFIASEFALCSNCDS